MAIDDDDVFSADNIGPSDSPRRGGAPELHTVRLRDKLRKQMETDVERFLRSGGRIEHLASHATGDQSRP